MNYAEHSVRMKTDEARYKSLLMSTKTPGMEDLLLYLQSAGFFKSPASANYHSAFDGGLCAHSLAVLNRFTKKIVDSKFTDIISEASQIKVALLHDICKVNLYEVVERWRKDNNNKWECYLTYGYVQERKVAALPHGVLSMSIAGEFIKLTQQEQMCICWHMGMEQDPKGFSDAVKQYPPVLLLHTADFEASRIDELDGFKEERVQK